MALPPLDTPSDSHPLPPLPPRRTLFARALRLRCPGCGGRPLFLTWTRMCPNCPTCGLQLERGEPGYWLGAYFFNLVIMEAVFVAGFVGVLVATWPTPPWTLLQYGTGLLMLLAPLVAFPFSKTLFLAFDLVCRPPTEEDYREPHEAARRPRPAPH
ncbi:MAG TPA: DUF983 domain-containing protein [Gemmatimonadales bacterium]|nr:DUF983 domain-containing protein [Gemmatimonadales bacterium]